MNTLQKTLIALATGSLLSVSAQAAVSYAGQPYVGVKAGQFNLDVDGVDTDKPTAYGVYGGYNFDPNFGVEVEYMGSDDADATFKDAKGLVYDGDISAKTYGAYGTYRYYFPNTGGLYGKAKLGVAKTKVDIDAKSKLTNDTVEYASNSTSDTGIAGGIGLGFSASPNLSVEAEYDMMDSDADAKLWTIGAHLKF